MTLLPSAKPQEAQDLLTRRKVRSRSVMGKPLFFVMSHIVMVFVFVVCIFIVHLSLTNHNVFYDKDRGASGSYSRYPYPLAKRI